MALYDVDVEVSFIDAGPKTAKVIYPLRQKFDTTDADTSIADIMTVVGTLETKLNVLTWDHVESLKVMFVVPGGGAAANVASNNQVHALTRCLDGNGLKCAFDVPAWDDTTFDRDSNDLLSAAYNAAAQDVADLLENRYPGGGAADFATVEWSQSRTHKTRAKVY